MTTTVSFSVGLLKCEIICKKETVLAYRNKELSMDDVVASEEIYKNASKGDVLSNIDFSYLFGNVSKQEALQIISANTSAIGLSLDVDGIDPVYAPAVGTPADGGLNPEQVMAIIAACKQHNWLGLEIAEFNPHNDIDQRTEKLLLDIIARVL